MENFDIIKCMLGEPKYGLSMVSHISREVDGRFEHNVIIKHTYICPQTLNDVHEYTHATVSEEMIGFGFSDYDVIRRKRVFPTLGEKSYVVSE